MQKSLSRFVTLLLLITWMGLASSSGTGASQPVEPNVTSGFQRAQVPPNPVQGTKAVTYPPIAIRCNLAGSVTLDLAVDERGKVSDATVERTSGYSALDEAAITSAKQWQYKPAMKDGIAVASRFSAMITFQPLSSAPPCRYLPPSAYSSGLPPNFSPVPPPNSALLPGEKLLVQDAIRMYPGMLSTGRVLRVPDMGETLRINYSLNPASAHVRLLVVTDEQQREENRGHVPTGKYPLDCTVSARGSQSVSLAGGDYWVLWLFADAPSDMIVSYSEIAAQGAEPAELPSPGNR